MKRFVCYALCIAALSLHVQSQPPQTQIHNKQLKLTIYLPGVKNQFYNGTRFDWSGWIGDLEFSGHHLYRPWFQSVDPSVRDVAYKESNIVVGPDTAMTGPAEEFQQPIGYDTAKPGDTFLKVGVGFLRKDNNDRYTFGMHFTLVDGGKWTVHKTAKSVTVEEVLGGTDKDYGYVYSKTIRLVGNSNQMVIEHHLKNTGRLPLATTVYDHNFLTIDGLGVGSADSVTAAYEIHPSRSPSPKAIRIDGRTAAYVTDLQGEDRVRFGLDGFGNDAKDYDYIVRNSAAHVQVHIVGDRPVVSAMVWSIRSVLAVEPTIQVQADPGQEFSWNYTYTFSADGK